MSVPVQSRALSLSGGDIYIYIYIYTREQKANSNTWICNQAECELQNKLLQWTPINKWTFII